MTATAPEGDDALVRLLDRLGAEGRDAGEAYESLRRLVSRYFEVRGRHDADVLTDDVLDRMARRLDSGTAIEEVGAYARGIARLVLLEAARRPRTEHLDVDPLAPTPAPDEEATDRCLSSCLAGLAPETREHLLTYYTADGRGRIDGRKRLAEQLRVSATALRLRMLRLRMQLEHCILRCRAAIPRNGSQPRSTAS